LTKEKLFCETSAPLYPCLLDQSYQKEMLPVKGNEHLLFLINCEFRPRFKRFLKLVKNEEATVVIRSL